MQHSSHAMAILQNSFTVLRDLRKFSAAIFNILAAEFPSTCKALRAIMVEFVFKDFFNLSPSREKYVLLLNITGSVRYKQRQRNVQWEGKSARRIETGLPGTQFAVLSLVKPCRWLTEVCDKSLRPPSTRSLCSLYWKCLLLWVRVLLVTRALWSSRFLITKSRTCMASDAR